MEIAGIRYSSRHALLAYRPPSGDLERRLKKRRKCFPEWKTAIAMHGAFWVPLYRRKFPMRLILEWKPVWGNGPPFLYL